MKIKLSEAQRLEREITETQTKLFDLLKEADSKGLELSQHSCNGTLDRYKYILTGVKVYIYNIEL